MNYKLSKNERLHSKKSIKELFDKGSSFFLYPFKVLFLEAGDSETNQVLFSVSKRKIRKAVHRNHVKRRMKEAYRLNKHLLDAVEPDKKRNIALIYVSHELQSFQDIQPKIMKILTKIAHTETP
ncbi:ribonuclease P protein component [Litoribacter ruber]|uniref:ribonuclease P protein component n=1 Tax=Litoribacter ruber TaxID=702568 RepID=UPI001BDB23E6|nr:ribonuclease P protein component [Litoribacter ruber]MBT0812284.1 ribonuclease P protein component [Litoribacter ruber]